jgi:adenylate kinase family enzyme
MKVYAFVGPSGSGKSYWAAWVAYRNGIEYIIDDGLLICGNKLLAGVSAKREKTRIGSIRRALFRDGGHAAAVREAIRQYSPESILILGTSDNMVDDIVRTLDLPPVLHRIYIEDVASQEEIDQARQIRKQEGKHVIPLPTFEIKKDFSGYFLDALHIFNKSKKSSSVFRTTKAVVRPTFSYLGSYHISNRVILTISRYEAEKLLQIAKVLHVYSRFLPEGLYLYLDVIMFYGENIKTVGRLVQRAVIKAVEEYTSLNVCGVDVTVKGIAVKR